MDFRENVSLAGFTTLGVGGPARWFADAGSEGEVREALAFAAARSLPLFVLGGGSNLLVADEGFPGVVLHMGLRGVRTTSQGPVEILEVGAGEDWDRFVGVCVAGGLAGLECLSGIPGTVGGTPVQNVGAYGQEVSSAIQSVRVLDRRSGETREMTRTECAFGYRASVFNTVERDRFIVLRVTFTLPHGAAPALNYRDVKEYFAARTGAAAALPSLAEVRNAVREIRARKAMLLVPGDPDCRSAGSFFKNPVVSEAQYAQICEAAGADAPRFPAGAAAAGAFAAIGKDSTSTTTSTSAPSSPALVKVPAAWLIERAGFQRGHARGRAGISSKHTLALVNRGGATATEILDLAREVRDGVERNFGVKLEVEPVMLGGGP
ncbi:MAG: UDP-N-acetylmuramate dehydrogenase [Candidatus Eisenbacteria bacterium]|nr:UDP-N-acetylmuramate dehydrogenase [Candidatus Eisenbacteria bacterium]